MYKLEDIVFFMHENKIKDGIIYEINIHRLGKSYSVEYLNNNDDLCTVTKFEIDLFQTVEGLLSKLKENYTIRI